MSQRSNEPIAIVGSACRFAGNIRSPSKLWEHLRAPVDLLREIPEDRFSVHGFYHAHGSHHGRTNVKHAYLLQEDLSAFDAEFFGVKPAEAKAMDPQQRLLMEVAYEALENAGVAIDDLRGSDTGVYVGSMSYDYSAMLLRDLSDLPVYTATGTGASILSNRLSYFFDWHGPSITLDTACSSSLVAVHLAVRALRSKESRTALVCGSNLILGPENFIIESKLNMLSPDGRGRMWDQNANGYARGEGIGVLVLKTLRAALEDGDDIEGVIRETMINQDGASNSAGITMPNASAQETLIRATYAKAGLDLNKPSERPQFFEAHGTGTPAGDPIEAEAVYNSFSNNQESNTSDRPPLYVGSVKTVLGHTEGTAGIAAIMKAALVLKHDIIPPNLLFSQVSDRVAPFYRGLEVPTKATAWPQGCDTRRASVNSFGFGGTNAHAILENYENPRIPVSGDSFAPYVFSAFSEISLRESLAAYATYLTKSPGINPQDLSWTLRKRRSVLPYRITFPTSSADELVSNITANLAAGGTITKALPSSKRGRVLGIFTGQGAQYPRMGAELIERSTMARGVIESLEASLAQLPDGPDWSLKAEILADGLSSRVYEAAISQPLCTAVQILLVDLLRFAGIEFEAVVGHSSGEIAAAYAAGCLTAEDAIRIAYYRGLHLQQASSPNGQSLKGAMLAVDSTLQDLEELCQDPVFLGRVSIAASNSSSSFTLSGDEDAIAEMQILFEDENKFSRRLKVDRAYHSDHMLPCFDRYVDSLVQCNIQPQHPSPTCIWVSSVSGRLVDFSTDISARYWAENMTRPVLFSQAVENVFRVASDPYDLVLEVGGHPALKAPTTQTIQACTQRDIPYAGLLSRRKNSVQEISAGLGFAWAHLESGRVDLDRYDRKLRGSDECFRVVKGLPTYSWNHENSYWHESRVSRKLRTRKNPVHCLLGDITPNSAAHCLNWKNILQLKELPWMLGHQVQGQVVFPAAGYLATALEAARLLANLKGKNLRLVDIEDFVVHQAVSFDTEDTGIEVFIQLTETVSKEKFDNIRAEFAYSAALSSNPDELTLTASCHMDILLGDASQTLLPERKGTLSHMIDVETDRFYQALAELGYEFSGGFKSLFELKRRHFRSTSRLKAEAHEYLMIHPVELDAMMQSCILAYSYPYDGQFHTLYLPTAVQRVRVHPAALPTFKSSKSQTGFFIVDAAIRSKGAESKEIIGDVNMYTDIDSNRAVQIQGAAFRPIGVSGEEHDKRIFSKTHWIDMSLDGVAIAEAIPLTDHHYKMLLLLERISTFYLRKFDRDIALDDTNRVKFPTNYYLNYARHITSKVKSGKQKWWRQEWLNDTLEDVLKASSPYFDVVDVEIMHLVGSQMPRVFRGETTMLEEFRAEGSDDVLDRYYAGGYGLAESALWVGRAVAQITNRYPHLNIIEIGAGTGSATKSIFREIGPRFQSYTYTDISPAFFENASNTFSQYGDRVLFKTFDAERDPLQQGYTEGAYDLVVAFFVIHATSNLEKALRHIRKLLRPGGFLVVGEGQEGQNGVASSGFVFGTLPGWWLGAGEDGRDLSPHVSPERWDHLLQNTGFSGVDVSVPESWNHFFNVYHFVTQAVNDEVQLLREPLTPLSWNIPPFKKLVIVGGQTSRSSHLVEGLRSQLSRGVSVELHVLSTLTDPNYKSILDADTTILSLTELDKPIFKDMTTATFEAFKTLFGTGKRIFWVTSGRLDDEPLCNMTVGFGRVAANESSGLRLQQLDVFDPENIDPRIIAEIFLRFHASEYQSGNILWSLEPEIILDTKGRQLTSRLRPVPELNDRYNSAQRTITHDKHICEHPLVLQPGPHGTVIKELSAWEVSVSETLIDKMNLLKLRTLKAVFPAIRTSTGYWFLALGARPEDGTLFLVLTDSLTSIITVSAESAVQVNAANRSEQDNLVAVASHLVASIVLDPLTRGQTILVHNVSQAINMAVRMEASAKGVSIVSTLDSPKETESQLSGFLTYPNLDDLPLVEADVFINFGGHEFISEKHETAMVSSLPAHCRIETAKTLFSFNGSHTRPSLASVLGDTLRRALEYAEENPDLRQWLSTASHPSNTLKGISQERIPVDHFSIIDFNYDSLVPVHASRLDTRPMFKGDSSTYWISGMTGALGISICDWMIENGARNIVISSRRPEISPSWIVAHKKRGANVVPMSCDVTNENEVKAIHKSICEKLPPIAGVMNGAMVLRDVSIPNMSFEQLIDVTKPKVDGSIYLDRIFYDTDLDFFVLVSSINCVLGSAGQANYAAANMFMCSLAAQRRKRGLRAATVNAGAIVGAGYMERESRRALDAIVQKLYMMRISEADWHQAIAEAIDASRLESDHGPELTTGLLEVPFDVANPPSWFSNPRFSEFIKYDKPRSKKVQQSETSYSLADTLRGCSSEQELQEVVKRAFSLQLRNILQVTISDDDLMASRSGEIGLDSLVAVDIRSWFLKNMQVNVPVLKIMSNNTMDSLVHHAIQDVPAELVPCMSSCRTTRG